MITPTEHPVFVPRYRPDHGGNDFLGLRAVNTTLMGQCLPGINNVSQYLRPFSLIAWIFWKFYQLASAAHLKSPTNEQQRIWQEKVELLFTWSHVLNGVQVFRAREPFLQRAVGCHSILALGRENLIAQVCLRLSSTGHRQRAHMAWHSSRKQNPDCYVQQETESS